MQFVTTMLAQLAQMGTATPLVPDGEIPWLTILTFGPLLGVFALMFIPKEQDQILRNTALITTLGIFVLSLGVLFGFDAATPATAGPFTFQLQEGPIEWIPSLGVTYFMGIDGISLWLVILTTFIMPIAIFSTYDAVRTHVKEYMICLLLLEVGMIGALVSLDAILFYFFWEMMLIPMYLIIGIWGGEERIQAAVKFFIYTMVGSLLMLISIFYVYYQAGTATGEYSFLFTDLLAVELTFNEQVYLFLAFFLAFAIKVPLFPFHTWLPLAHVQAPTAGSVILAGVLLKMGTYGLLRYAFPLFPDATRFFAPYIAILCVIGIVYGAMVAMVQDDVKKLVAYSSVSHLGFCVLGLIAMTPAGIAGGIFVMIAHGIATGGLFLCVGILYERRHTKKIAAFGGIAKSMPVFAAMFMIIVFASVGLPGLNGFVGEFLALIGTSQSRFLFFDSAFAFVVPSEAELNLLVESGRLTAEQAANHRSWVFMEPLFYPRPDDAQAGPEFTAYLFAGVGASGVIFAAGYLLWMWRRVMFGPLDKPENEALQDLNLREILYLTPIVLMAIFMGVFPQFFLGRMEPSIHQFLGYMQAEVTNGEDYVVVEPPAEGWVPEGKMLDKTDEAAQ